MNKNSWISDYELIHFDLILFSKQKFQIIPIIFEYKKLYIINNNNNKYMSRATLRFELLAKAPSKTTVCQLQQTCLTFPCFNASRKKIQQVDTEIKQKHVK